MESGLCTCIVASLLTLGGNLKILATETIEVRERRILLCLDRLLNIRESLVVITLLVVNIRKALVKYWLGNDGVCIDIK